MMDNERCPYQCDHDHVVIRRRTYADGRQVASRQCLRCGKDCGSVPKASVVFDTLSPFDEALRKGWEEKVHGWYEGQRQRYLQGVEQQNAEWWRRYEAHMASEKWKSLRDKVLVRCNGLCEGCGVRVAKHVHHLTYAHLGDELLFELVGLCHDCHDRAHGRVVSGRLCTIKGVAR
jgi:hypothetical protein